MRHTEWAFVTSLKINAAMYAVMQICEETIKECNAKGEPCPAKFGLGREGAQNILAEHPISKLVFRAVLDVIGGYYSTSVYYKEHHDPTADLKGAEMLMEAAKNLEAQAPVEFRIVGL